MKTQSELIAYLRSHPDKTDRQVRCAHWRHRVTTYDVQEARRKLTEGRPPDSHSNAVPAPTPKPRSRVLEQFRQEHDIAYKIRLGIARLKEDEYMTDGEFREHCGVHVNQWRRYAEMEEFRPNRLKHAGQWFWGREQTIVSMKRIIGALN